MTSPDYVWDKMYVAIDCLCGPGSFVDRLEDATISSLVRLDEDDLTGELAEDLKFILGWTKNNIIDGKIQKPPDEFDRKKLIEKMLHVMLETHLMK